MNLSNFKKVRHHHMPGDIGRRDKIARREANALKDSPRANEYRDSRLKMTTAKDARKMQAERTRAVLKSKALLEDND